MTIFDRLNKLNIAYDRVDHPAVYTVAEARELVPPMDGKETKNLFLTDKRKKRHFLMTLAGEKRADLATLAGQLGVSRLSFASPNRLETYLGITPGAVSLLAIVNDVDGQVEVVIDSEVWSASHIKCHPLVNTATLRIAQADIAQLLSETGHDVTVVDC